MTQRKYGGQPDWPIPWSYDHLNCVRCGIERTVRNRKKSSKLCQDCIFIIKKMPGEWERWT